MNHPALPNWLLCLCLLTSGCATYVRRGLDPAEAAWVERTCVRQEIAFFRECEDAVLALDPNCVTEQDLRDVLSGFPAPRIINIHGGIYPVHKRMVSFSEFLIGMGYPAASIANPGDGTYTFSCYEGSAKIAGAIAWYYSREGLRPMVLGHSQGGMETVKVLRLLGGLPTRRLHLWNPLTWQREESCAFLDPLGGTNRPVVGLQLPWASAVGAGGLTRLLPNQWDMFGVLRDIPNSVEEFTGFCKGRDLLGGDYLGYGSANHYKPMDRAVVRNVWLPSAYKHGAIPDTRHLLESRAITDWINRYQPSTNPVDTPRLDREFDADSHHILWAAEVWYSIKKHWVLELQRKIRAKREREGAG